jgi:hypothetical protein
VLQQECVWTNGWDSVYFLCRKSNDSAAVKTTGTKVSNPHPPKRGKSQPSSSKPRKKLKEDKSFFTKDTPPDTGKIEVPDGSGLEDQETLNEFDEKTSAKPEQAPSVAIGEQPTMERDSGAVELETAVKAVMAGFSSLHAALKKQQSGMEKIAQCLGAASEKNG